MSNIHELLNTILNEYIPKSKVNKFSKLLSKHSFDPNSFSYIAEEKRKRLNILKISISELRERIHIVTVADINNDIINNDINDMTDHNELLEKCDQILHKIKREDHKSKKYYYTFGFCLTHLKLLLTLNGYTINEFNNFVEERFRMKYSTLAKYIKFSTLGFLYPVLLNCDLGFSEIMNNTQEIEKLMNEDFSIGERENSP